MIGRAGLVSALLIAACGAFVPRRRGCGGLLSPSSVTHELGTLGRTALYGKKKKGKAPGANPNYKSKKSGQPKQEKSSVQEARFDAATR